MDGRGARCDVACGAVVERAEGDGPFEPVTGPRGGTEYEGVSTLLDPTAEPGKTYRYRARQVGYVDDVRVLSPPSDEAVAQLLPSDLTVPVTPVLSRPGLHADWLTPPAGPSASR